MTVRRWESVLDHHDADRILSDFDAIDIVQAEVTEELAKREAESGHGRR